MTERLQQATQRIGRRLTLRDKLCAAYRQQPQQLRIHTLDRNLAEPAGPHQLRPAMRIIGVDLIDLHAQGGLGVTCVEADDRHAACAQGPGQKIRQQDTQEPELKLKTDGANWLPDFTS